MAYLQKSITIRPDQERAVEDASLNLSRFVQRALDEKFGCEPEKDMPQPHKEEA